MLLDKQSATRNTTYQYNGDVDDGVVTKCNENTSISTFHTLVLGHHYFLNWVLKTVQK